ncbi:hypothetical protein HKBW3S25_00865 [Candidatus Hakubella thermalkaliphila]|uniref:Uncharacterized protein n=1 Tax=Candidatus Hakubella thermalkaliphila TaxID=2754717 RepID=A0A6V8NZD9_9ACTN|nr:hypothetical protein HKBW3S25_00865 [Candidatus Hakubella thermalkaliphila]
MDKESLAILRAETQVQIGEIERIYAKLEERKRKRGKTGIESVAYQLHNLYCAFKDLFKIIANTFENHIQDKSQYHLELLKRMTILLSSSSSNSFMTVSIETAPIFSDSISVSFNFLISPEPLACSGDIIFTPNS